jgi:hypothetical protein
MNLLRIAALLIVCGVTVNSTDKSKMVQDSGSKPTAQQDNVPKSIADSMSGPLQFVEGSFLGVAEAMPENKYSYIPTAGNFDGVRSFGEQVKHVACAQFAFFNEFEGKKPPEDCEKGGHDLAKSKPELINTSRIPSTTLTASWRRSPRKTRSNASKAATPDPTPSWAFQSSLSGTSQTTTGSL